MALFLIAIRRSNPRVIVILSALFLCYLFLVTYPSHLRGGFSSLLEPTIGDWITVHGVYDGVMSQPGHPPIFLNKGVRFLFTLVSYGGLLGLIYSLFRSRRTTRTTDSATSISWRQLGFLLAPFTLAYIVLLLSVVATTNYLFDRYALGFLIVPLICLVRYYQERIQARLPLATVFLVAAMAIYGIAVTHNTFSLYRARVALAAELRAKGVPDTAVDNGWEYNLLTELQQSNHINDFRIVIPAHAYVPPAPQPAGTRIVSWSNFTPHVHPIYGVSSNPNACYGPAPFAPTHYSRWPYRSPGTLYVVRYLPPITP